MNKMFSFLAGAMCGALIGAVTAILLAPVSGEELRATVQTRLDEAIQEGKRATEETQKRLEAQFAQMKGEA